FELDLPSACAPDETRAPKRGPTATPPDPASETPLAAAPTQLPAPLLNAPSGSEARAPVIDCSDPQKARPDPGRPKRPKRSTQRGEGRDKLIAALTAHHQYESGSCLNLEPTANNELARQADVAPSTASAFFKKEFDGYRKYRAICRNAGRLADSL